MPLAEGQREILERLARSRAGAPGELRAKPAPSDRCHDGCGLGTSPHRPACNGRMPPRRERAKLVANANPGVEVTTMEGHEITHLIVAAGGRPVGILSTLDIAGVLAWGRA